MQTRTIVGIGGFPNEAMLEYVLTLARGRRLLSVPTALAEGPYRSAGMICWFEAGVTDSFGPQLEGMRDGLGFLPGSACPHYDGEERRRPV